ncbi:MAG: 6-phosphogluconolactonase [Candidatus Eisenbacteria bacterium]
MKELSLTLARPGYEFADAAASRVLRGIRESIVSRGRASVGLAGGDTPRAIHAAILASPETARIGWSYVDFYFSDERCVPPEHPESNYGMALETLFSSLPVLPERIHRIEGERSDRERAAEEYAAGLPPSLDLLLLGMGADTHTASLFPGSPAILETRRRAVAVEAPAGVRWRVTITPPVIASARHILVAVAGKEKARAVQQAITGPVDPLRHPIQLADGAEWILDAEAARELPPPLLDEAQNQSQKQKRSRPS